MQTSADFVTKLEKFLLQLKALQKRLQKDVKRFFVAQAVSEIYGKKRKVEKQGVCVFLLFTVLTLFIPLLEMEIQLIIYSSKIR